jgi:hypothetical protein
LRRARTDARRAELQALLELPPFPVELSYIWEAYLKLRKRQGFDAMGNPKALAWRGVEAWMHLMRFTLTAWECDVLMDLDDTYLSSIHSSDDHAD